MSAFRRLNAQLRGTGDRAMVFAHGFGCDQRMWRHVAPQFENEFVTVLYDHVGSGLSDLSAYSADRYSSLRAYAHDLVELGREVPFEGAVLVGHSCGAMIGLLASIEAPGMFGELVLVSASPRYLDDSDYVGGFSGLEVDGMLQQLREDYPGWSKDMAPIFMGNRHRPELAQELLQSFQRSDPKVAADFGTVIFTSDLRAELAKVRAECLIVQCQEDPVVPNVVAHYLSAHIENCRLQTIATDGHFPHLSAPDRLVESIRQFVSDGSFVSKGAASAAVLPLPEWPMIEGTDVRLSSGTWSRRLPPLSDVEGRAELEELLLKRVGELSAHLGRYDMYALAITRWLDDASNTAANVRTRGAIIKALLLQRRTATAVIAHFEAIDAELMDVLDRHEIAAKNCAVVPAFKLSATRALRANPRDWYEYATASDQELLFFIDAVERDILSVASLYARLADFATILGDP
jgi:sigma-B regulation protein RsbQ